MRTSSLPLVGRRGIRKSVALFAPVFGTYIQSAADRGCLTQKQNTRFVYSGRHSRVQSMFHRNSISENEIIISVADSEVGKRYYIDYRVAPASYDIEFPTPADANEGYA